MNYYGGGDSGQNLPIVCVINKENGFGDFYFQRGFDLEFTATQPRVITSVTTSIHDPDMRLSNVSGDSAVIFKITKQNNANLDVVQDVLQLNQSVLLRHSEALRIAQEEQVREAVRAGGEISELSGEAVDVGGTGIVPTDPPVFAPALAPLPAGTDVFASALAGMASAGSDVVQTLLQSRVAGKETVAPKFQKEEEVRPTEMAQEAEEPEPEPYMPLGHAEQAVKTAWSRAKLHALLAQARVPPEVAVAQMEASGAPEPELPDPALTEGTAEWAQRHYEERVAQIHEMGTGRKQRNQLKKASAELKVNLLSAKKKEMADTIAKTEKLLADQKHQENLIKATIQGQLKREQAVGRMGGAMGKDITRQIKRDAPGLAYERGTLVRPATPRATTDPVKMKEQATAAETERLRQKYAHKLGGGAKKEPEPEA
jgi:hypothetical protein